MSTRKLIKNKIYEQGGTQVVLGIVDKYPKILILLSLLCQHVHCQESIIVGFYLLLLCLLLVFYYKVNTKSFLPCIWHREQL